MNNIVAIAHNIYNFVYTATGYPARYLVSDQPDIWQMKPDVSPDTGYKKGLISGTTLVSGAQKPISGAPKPVSGAEKPVSGAEKPVSEARNPVSRAEKPV